MMEGTSALAPHVNPTRDNSLASRFNPRHNSLNFLRLVLAISVVVSHAWPLGGYGSTVGVGRELIGDWGVDGFFAISGFLILGSRLNSASLRDFFWRRVLRIGPAFVVALLVVAFVAAPFSVFVLHNGTYDAVSAGSYVLKNLGLWIFQPGIDGTLVGVGESANWNAPLWTLSYEFGCYIAIAILVTALGTRVLGSALAFALVALTAVNVIVLLDLQDLPDPLVVFSRMGSFFAAGALAFQYRDRIVMNRVGAVGALIACVGLVVAQGFEQFGALPIAYLLLYLGIVLPCQKVGARNDLSYGVYIYAYPVQLLLIVWLGKNNISVWVYLALTLLVALGLSALSWFYVEKPAIALKHLTASRGLSRGRQRGRPR